MNSVIAPSPGPDMEVRGTYLIKKETLNLKKSILFYFSQDCNQAIEEFFNEKLFIIGYVGIGIAGIMVRTWNCLNIVLMVCGMQCVLF